MKNKSSLLSFLLLAMGLLLASRAAIADTAVSLLESFAGNVNFVGTQETLRTKSNSSDPCALVKNATTTNGSNATFATLAGVPSGATILKAYLYWAGSGSTPDYNVTFQSASVSAAANRRYTANTGGTRNFFSGVADVTSIVAANAASGITSYSFANLTVDDSNTYCDNSTVLGGWALLVIYSDSSEPFRVLNLYEGFQSFSDSSITLPVSNFRVPTPLTSTGKHGHITWEGDSDIGGSTEPETLSFGGVVLSDGNNPANNQFNSYSNIGGDNPSYGIDFDAYPLTSTHLTAGQTSANTVYKTSQDLVLLSAEIVAVPNTPTADLAVTLTRSGPLYSGLNASYTINVTNNGPNTHSGTISTTIEGAWPAALTPVSVSGTGWDCSGGTSCTYSGNLAAGASAPPLTITVTVGATASGSVSLGVRVTGSLFDHISGNNTATDTTTIVPRPNHIRIEHDGAGLTCAPETVTIKACADAACSTLFTGPVTTTLSPAGWDSNPISFSGGSTTASLSITSAQTVTLGAGSTSPVPAAATPTRCFNGGTETCSMTFTLCTYASCGNGTITAPGGIINTYYPVSQNLAAGATTIAVGSPSGSSTQIAAGDLVLIMQMQDAAIVTTDGSGYGAASSVNAGKYEYATVAWVVGSTVKLTSGLVNAYTYQAGTNAVQQKTIQLIRVPTYSSGSLGAGLTASAWNGSTGGVLAFDVSGTLNLNNATVDLTGKGFRGGAGRQLNGGTGTSANFVTMSTNNANGSKGEGIAGTPRYVNNAGALLDNTVEGYPTGSYAKGSPANAGGGGTDDNPSANDENTGGGGGGNAGAGGLGGFGWNAASSPGQGIGGKIVDNLGPAKLTLGGGGGAGSTNNGTGTPGNGLASSGAAGGGIIMLRAGSVTGTGTFNVSGASGNTTVANDGSGGGGAAGAVMVFVQSGGVPGLTIQARGGTGGSNTGGGSAHGPGGGGGGGYAITSGAPLSCSVTGGASGTTSGSIAYGAAAGGTGTCVSALASPQIIGAPFGTGPCATAVNHYAISHGGTGITCEAEPVIITAHDNSHGRVTADTRTVTLTARNVSGGAATGTWLANADSCSMTCYDATGATKTCANSLTGSTGNNGVASYTFGSGESGVRVCLKQTSAITQNIDVSDATATEGATEDANLVFSDTGIRFYRGDAVDTLGTLYAGMRSDLNVAGYQANPPPLTIRALKNGETTPARCVPLLANTTQTVQFAYQCVDPGSCHAASGGLQVNGTSVAGTGSVPTPSSNVPVTFDANGYGSINLKYWDVGMIKLYAKATAQDAVTGTGVNILTGSSNTFLVRPLDFLVSACVSGASCPATVPPSPDLRPTGGGGKFVEAGAPFKTTITARSYDDGTGARTTPSFGLGTNAGSETVSLSNTLVGPAGGNNPALGGVPTIYRSSFVDGAATISNLSWGEVGVITLTAQNSLFMTQGVTTTGTSSNVGRFVPDHFDTTLGGAMACPAAMACPSTNFAGFVYSGQPFTTTVTAYNRDGVKTQNYAGGFARDVALTAWDAAGSTATQNPAAGTPTGFTVSAGSFTGGVATVGSTSYTLPNAYPAAAPPPGPTRIHVRATESGGTDAVTSRRAAAPETSVEGGIMIASGRFWVQNAYGSALLRLPIGGTAQYFDGTRWVTSVTDSTSTVDPANVQFDNLRNLTAVNLAPGAAVQVVNGVCPQGRCFVLAAPNTNGSVDMRLTSPAWLPSSRGRATFGLHRSSVIYIREMY